MKSIISFSAVLLSCALAVNGAEAATLTEDFDEPFSGWESRFMGTESNLQNYYVVQGQPITDRGNNPDGLWLADGDALLGGDDVVEILFNSAFGSSLTSLSFRLSTWLPNVSVGFFDSFGASLGVFGVTQDVLYTPVLQYGVSSSSGIGGFRLLSSPFGAPIEGNTSIDAISVTTGGNVSPVPVPASGLLIVGAFAALCALNRRSKGYPTN